MHATREAARSSRHRVTASEAASVATAKSATVTATTAMPAATATVLGKRGCAYGQERRQGTNCP